MSHRIRQALKKGAFAAIPLVVLLVLTEIVLRLFAEAPEVIDVQGLYRTDEVDYVETAHKPDSRFIVVTPVGTRLKKNFKAVIHNHRLSGMTTTVQTNSLGYRDEEIGEKGEHEFRVLVLGDSITFLAAVPASLTYPAYIQTYLERSDHPALRGKTPRAINAGIGGIDLANEYSILMETGLSTKPDVVVGSYLNDAYRSISIDVTRLPGFLQRSYLVSFFRTRVDGLRKQLAYERARMKLVDEIPAIEQERSNFAATHEMAPSATNWATSDAAFNRLIHDTYLDVGFAWSGKYWEIIERNGRLFQQVEAENDFKLVFILFPFRHQVQTGLTRNEPQQQFEEVMGRLGVEHLDLLPLLRRKYREDGVNVYYDQCHMKPEGNEFVGRAIADHIVDHVLRN